MRRRDTKPKDPTCRAFVPRSVAERVAAMLTKAYGPSLPPDLAVLIQALEDGVAHYNPAPRSIFTCLARDDNSLVIPTRDVRDVRRVKTSAHSWAQYHGHKIATRSHPHGTAVTVYLVKRAGT